MYAEDFMYAEKLPYWDTTVSLGKSQGEITDILTDFHCDQVQFTQGTTRKGGLAWLIRFSWQGRSYRFVFEPAKPLYPEKIYTRDKKKYTGSEAARLQMGRIALNFVKAILTAAAAKPEALFAFLELPDILNEAGLPVTTAELNVQGLVKALPPLIIPPPLLPGDNP